MLMIGVMCIGSIMASDNGIFIGEAQERGATVVDDKQHLVSNVCIAQSNSLIQELNKFVRLSSSMAEHDIIEEYSQYLYNNIVKKFDNMQKKAQKMKHVLGMHDEFEISYEELKQIYFSACIISARFWVENNNENDIKKSNLSVYKYYKTHKNEEPCTDFLYVVMRLLMWEKLENANDIVQYVSKFVTDVTTNGDSKGNGIKIYQWFCENDEDALGEFHA